MARGAWIFAAALALPFACVAGRPLSTEDVGVVDAGRCQLESWIDRSRDATTGWLVPACNVGLGIEWQAGFARTRGSDASGRFSEAYAQAKGTLVEPADGRAGLGWVVGTVRRPLAVTHGGWSNPYAVAIASSAFDETLVHANVGWARDRDASRNATTWGLAIELPPRGPITWVAEAFGENSTRPFLRAGARWTAVADLLDLDLTYVARPGGDRSERYLSLGFTLLTPAPRR